ncbi:low molecular weight protein-tyrosine-phosphatase [Nitratireductor basaltis]|uniref:protein-tyrosine-phosphatase n=1 Tax=Nitratireductor basaltis TaxID=472175 RepID=A0A084U6Q3_9HYPH|nr:low molecular weight protein-tyrosine-phosphatase [Nitratireductor basaltis]KFB08639.1 Protein-tyrosine phosphatase, low molecular weight [Nitratireductor basaltis]
MSDSSISVLFVCLGNICRSPLAEGVFRDVLDEHGLGDRFRLDSAGTGAWHIGAAPDRRAIAVAARHGVDISGLRGRQVEPADFSRFDHVMCMDARNLRVLRQLSPLNAPTKAHLFMEYAGLGEVDVPDPFYGSDEGFETVYQMIREASEALATRFAEREGSALMRGQASSIT